ncbi:MAG: hypothetical protein ABI948_08095 [Thermoleophilia bacterium]
MGDLKDLLDGGHDPLLLRLAAKMSRTPGGCWVWRVEARRSSAGSLFLAGEGRDVARLVWEIETGCPPCAPLRPVCGEPRCVNPGHLFEGEKPRAERCLRGHDLDDASNVHVDARGRRTCLACLALRQRQRRARLRVVA